jgi:CubicO group peptidase (beta-lactamase class C family)
MVQAQNVPPVVESRGPSDPAELEVFLDGIMAAHKESHHVVGATVSVVAQSRVLLAKGYGHADLRSGKPVDPARTLFRIGSVTKLFTWTAAMQLAEQGKLDLGADLNRYLDEFKIPATFPEPITMAHLMSHTPGFEDRVIGLFARGEDSLIPLGRLLSRELPARVRPPGQLAAYSNHGTALAGYVVERLSGLTWEEYVERSILEPLGMKHTAVRQPVPSHLAADMSAGYRYTRGAHEAKEFEFVPARPAGSMGSCAADMAQFMIAFLEGGKTASGRILSEASVTKMQERIFSHDSQINGMLHGFYEMNRNGERVLGHGGDTFWFHTVLALLPERRVGIFASYNCDGGPRARDGILSSFLDRYFPERSASRTEVPAGRNFARFAGSYRATRVSHTTLSKLGILFSALKVSVTPEGQLMISGAGPRVTRWTEAKPDVFREIEGPDTLVFREDSQGNVTHLFLGGVPMIAFVRMGAWETPELHLAAFGLTMAVFASALVAWPWIGIRRRWKPDLSAPRPPRGPRLIAWVACAFLAAFLAGMAAAMTEPSEIAFGIPAGIRRALYLPLFALPFCLASAVFAVLAWRNRLWGLAGRIHYTIVAAALFAFLGLLHYWNLLGFHVG